MLFLFAFFVLFCFVYRTPGLYWLWIKVSITVIPHEHHGVSEQRQLRIKGQNSALLTHCEGGGGGMGGTPVISGFPSKRAINAENVSMLCGLKCLKSGTHIKYHVQKTLLNSLEARLFVQQLIQVNKKEDSYYCPFVKTIHRYPMDSHAITPTMREIYIYVMTSSRVKMLSAFRLNTLNTFMMIASCMAKCRYVIRILRDKMDEILETIFSSAVVHIMARAQQTTCYYLNQWGPN